MTALWKLTDGKHQTRGGLQWGENITRTAPGNGELCTDAYVHASTDPLLAVALAPIHVDYPELVLWRAEGVVERSDGLKVGCTSLTTLSVVPLPEISTAARVRWAIKLAYPLCERPAWRAWADAWLSGEDRSRRSAKAAEVPAWVAPWAAAAAAAWSEAEAAYAASMAAAVSAGQALDLAAVLREAIAAEVQA